MNCPHCGAEMKKGYLYNASQPVQWIPEGKKRPFWTHQLAADAIELGEGDWWDGYQADAYFCFPCKMVIIPME